MYGLSPGDQSSHTIHKVRIYYGNNGFSVYLSSFAILLCVMERQNANQIVEQTKHIRIEREKTLTPTRRRDSLRCFALGTIPRINKRD